VRFHKIREMVSTGDLLLEKIHNSENAVDMLTKLITANKFKHYLDLINVSNSRKEMRGGGIPNLPVPSGGTILVYFQGGEYSHKVEIVGTSGSYSPATIRTAQRSDRTSSSVQ
jgi:hypothetical protein